MSVEIWCIAEHRGGVLDADTWQLLGAAKKLGGTAVAVVCAADPAPLAEQLSAGADKVITLRHEVLADFTPGGYAQAILTWTPPEDVDLRGVNVTRLRPGD